MMGSGKTTVGRRLAARWSVPFLDSDEQVEARTGRTVADIFRTDGEPAFRRLEAEALAAALRAEPAGVIAAAGGVVLDAGNRALLASSGTVVWLRADAAVLLARIGAAGDDHRPLLDDDPATVLDRMARDRTELYAEVADLVIDVDHRTPTQVAGMVEAAVTSEARS
jgi:shikimate kinase